MRRKRWSFRSMTCWRIRNVSCWRIRNVSRKLPEGSLRPLFEHLNPDAVVVAPAASAGAALHLQLVEPLLIRELGQTEEHRVHVVAGPFGELARGHRRL